MRDKRQCQVCGARPGDPYCMLHAHHRVPRAKRGPDTLDNLITLCDLCHAVVTRRWWKPWFGAGALEAQKVLEHARETYVWFLALRAKERTRIQAILWKEWGVRPD